jgi:copper resistance protein B
VLGVLGVLGTDIPILPTRASRHTWALALAMLALCPRPSASLRAQAPAPMPTMGAAVHDMRWGRTTFLMSEVLEYATGSDAKPVAFDLVGWSGGAIHRLWAKADGRVATRGQGTEGEYQVMYGRLVKPFWDAQLGVRTDVQRAGKVTRTRTGAVLGVQGLAPGWFEFEPTLFVPTDGNVTLDVTGSYDLYVTQRLVIQPRLESAFAMRDDDTFGASRGLSSASFGLRTRYEWRREFAPYAGVVWERVFGRAADVARRGGGEAGEVSWVFGLRVWR